MQHIIAQKYYNIAKNNKVFISPFFKKGERGGFSLQNLLIRGI